MTSLLIVTTISITTIADFKSTRKKSNWRDAASYLSKQYDENTLLIFSTIEPEKHWQPVFYGFDRYYFGNSHRITMPKLIEFKNEFSKVSLQVVFVIFHYRDYFLTSRSRFTFHLGIRNQPFKWKLSDWPNELDLKSYTGFSIVTLNEKSNMINTNTVDQAHYIIDNFLPLAPQDYAIIQYHLYAASLTPENYNEHKSYHTDRVINLNRLDIK